MHRNQQESKTVLLIPSRPQSHRPTVKLIQGSSSHGGKLTGGEMCATTVIT